ncbi:MAG: rhomboid family intramembrane serine protease [Gemmatimonadetes bacterium]|nr:rhomboid family intramembrane serine protease [Gemmatimonadota bacterium]
MQPRSPFSVTPWVLRLLVANALVYLLTITVFTGRWFFEWFAFSPSLIVQQPWTAVTYVFLHGSFFHLAFNMLWLFFFGRDVEDWMGGTAFARYYLLCGLGGAAASFAFLPIAPVNMVVGASGAVFGVALAFAVRWPDAKMFIFPLPVPIKVKWLVVGFVSLDLLAGLGRASDGIAHFAHLGGFLAGLGYLRFGNALPSRTAVTVHREPVRVLAHPTAQAAEEEEEVPAQAPPARPPSPYDEVDRVLDKISATGLESLSPKERKLLDEMSERLRKR